uniref:NADH dehydrogenase subunit 4L n=1 Tax=Forcipomyia pulchrithorax TaxID=3042879 RepID=UPI002A83A793|nr:NADH dehydrogenase subunit 4L [Forcipomyia pulchrithorax]WOR86776.1 NADH dehydrogenase subunit 4L [Forcipomyia pulchrithorax]
MLMLTFINLLFYMVLFIFSLMVFISRRKHLLVTLISLEFIVLVLYLYMYNFLCLMSYEYYFSMVFLTFSVCEGALGLSILVSLIRTHGTDYFQSYNILQC